MRLGVLRSAIITLALTLASAAPLFAQSDTSLSGAISGRELCAQDMCGSAILFFGMPSWRRPKPILPSTVMWGKSAYDWNIMLTGRSYGGRVVMS